MRIHGWKAALSLILILVYSAVSVASLPVRCAAVCASDSWEGISGESWTGGETDSAVMTAGETLGGGSEEIIADKAGNEDVSEAREDADQSGAEESADREETKKETEEAAVKETEKAAEEETEKETEEETEKEAEKATEEEAEKETEKETEEEKQQDESGETESHEEGGSNAESSFPASESIPTENGESDSLPEGPPSEEPSSEELSSEEPEAQPDENPDLKTLPDAAEILDEAAFIPSMLVGDRDLKKLIGEGIDPEVDETLDAVSEILNAGGEDLGLKQMAAGKSGKTREAMEEAAEALKDRAEAVPEEIAEALLNAGAAKEQEVEENRSLIEQVLSGLCEEVEADEDHQGGISVPYQGADSLQDAMAYVSSFLLSDVRDGAGDFDDLRSYTPEGDGFDWNGNDSADHNGVVRTNDDVIYTFSYTTALNESYIYNTISGTRLYVEYTLPMRSSEAVFHTEAMPWMRGEGDGNTPVVYYMLPGGEEVTELREGQEAVSQRLVGYRDLPDRQDEGGAYDVPGAGTLNCILSVKDCKSRDTVIEPVFKAWLMAASGNGAAPSSDITVTSANPKGFESVRVTSGPFVSLILKKNANGYYPETLYRHNTFSYYDGNMGLQSGSGQVKGFHFDIIAGKPNGNTKGASEVDNTEPIKVEFNLESWTNDPDGTEAGLYDLRTGGMDADESGQCDVRFFYRDYDSFAGETMGIGLGALPTTDVWAGRVQNVNAENGTYSFEITGFRSSGEGDVLTSGELFFFQKMPEYGTISIKYALKLTVPYVTAVSKLDGQPRRFAQQYIDSAGNTQVISSVCENSVEGPGSWDSHIYFKYKDRVLGGTETFVTGSVPYGVSFTLEHNIESAPKGASDQEQSSLSIILWDNTKITLDTDGNPGGVNWAGRGYGTLQENWRPLWITAASGDALDAESMKRVSLLSYRDLRYFTSLDSAYGYLDSLGKPRENIAGMALEWFGASKTPLTATYKWLSQYSLKFRPDVPPENIIGSTVEVTQNVLSFHGLVLNRNRSIWRMPG